MKVEGGRRKVGGSVLVCFPLKEEAAPFRKIAARKTGIAVLLTGIGRRNAERAVRDFLAGGASVPAGRLVSGLVLPELVLTCGFAGGLNPDLKLGEVVFEMADRRDALPESPSASEVRDSQSSSLRQKLIATGARPAKFFCADRIATTVAEKKKLRDETGADAVEMESAAVRAVCVEHGIPCATVRVISDTAQEDLPLDFNALARPDQSLDYGKLFMAIAQSPGKIGALLKLQKQTRFAAEQLTEVLAGIL
jgi:adenosylhomocysteine nucleosidase